MKKLTFQALIGALSVVVACLLFVRAPSAAAASAACQMRSLSERFNDISGAHANRDQQLRVLRMFTTVDQLRECANEPNPVMPRWRLRKSAFDLWAQATALQISELGEDPKASDPSGGASYDQMVMNQLYLIIRDRNAPASVRSAYREKAISYCVESLTEDGEGMPYQRRDACLKVVDESTR